MMNTALCPTKQITIKKEIYVLLFIINNKENNNKNSPQVTIKRKSGSKNI